MLMSNFKDLTGKRFGRLLVIEKLNNYRNNFTRNHIDYKVLCDCGTEKIVRGTSLTKKKSPTKSCGCWQKEKAKENGKRFAKEPGLYAKKSLYKQYQNSAKNRKIGFNIQFEAFLNLTRKNCFYCGIEPKNIKKVKTESGNYIYNGLDRIDSSKDYTLDNVVPCCAQCNSAKLDYSTEEFYNWIIRIYNKNLKVEIK